jgi:hypothetical protein
LLELAGLLDSGKFSTGFWIYLTTIELTKAQITAKGVAEVQNRQQPNEVTRCALSVPLGVLSGEAPRLLFK